MSQKRAKRHYLDLFAGGIPPYTMFTTHLHLLNEILQNCPDVDADEAPSHIAIPVCFVSLTAYFEAFSKDTFAAAVNVCPQLLENLVQKRPGDTLQLNDLVHVKFDLRRTLGFLAAEHRDFGSPKAFNTLFNDLLGITPLSKKEVAKFADFLDLRNLLVHHGGVFTCGYARRHGFSKSDYLDLFNQGPLFARHDLYAAFDFFQEIAKKTTEACWKGIQVQTRLHKWKLDAFHKKAMNYLMIGIDRGWTDVIRKMK